MNYFLALLRIGNDVQQKGWYTSKTIWFNILTLVGVISAKYGMDLSADDLMAIAAGLSTVGNIILRTVTDTPVGGKTVPLPVQPAAETHLPGDEKPFGLS